MTASRLLKVKATLLFACCVGGGATADERGNDPRQWHFDVYLDDKLIGEHIFELDRRDDELLVTSEARFKLNVLLVPVLRYEHQARERWQDGCLVSLRASTSTNGERIAVAGVARDDAFQLAEGEQDATLPPCIKSFAYWTPEILDETRLLNPQTGEYVAVDVTRVGTETLRVAGVAVSATRYRLNTGETDLTLWYSADNEWVGLQTEVRGGRLLTYELAAS